MNPVKFAEASPQGRPEARRFDAESSADSRLAWQREMERAQASSWFGHAPAVVPNASAGDARRGDKVSAGVRSGQVRLPFAEGSAASNASAVSRSSAPAVHNAMAAARSARSDLSTAPLPASRFTPACVPAGTPAPPDAHADARADTDPAPSGRSGIVMPSARPADAAGGAGLPVAGDSRPVLRRIEESPIDEAPGGSSRRAPDRDGVPVRIHVQPQGRHAAVWLGVDAPLLDRVPTLIEAVTQSLRRSGIVLGALVCNGRTLDAARQAAPVAEEAIQPIQGERK